MTPHFIHSKTAATRPQPPIERAFKSDLLTRHYTIHTNLNSNIKSRHAVLFYLGTLLTVVELTFVIFSYFDQFCKGRVKRVCIYLFDEAYDKMQLMVLCGGRISAKNHQCWVAAIKCDRQDMVTS